MTLVSCLLLFLVVAVGSVALYSGIYIQNQQQIEIDKKETDVFNSSLQAYSPEKISSSALAPIPALHLIRGNRPSNSNVALSTFSLDGPDLNSAVSIKESIRDIAYDSDSARYYAINSHDVGTLSHTTGQFVKFNLDDVFDDFSWPKGIAYDSNTKAIVVMTSHVYNYWFTYSLQTGEWKQLAQRNRGESLSGLAFASDRNRLYSIVTSHREKYLSKIAEFNSLGTITRYIELQKPIPIGEHSSLEVLQIGYSSGKILLIVPTHPKRKDYIYAVDPDSGTVMATQELSKSDSETN